MSIRKQIRAVFDKYPLPVAVAVINLLYLR